MLSKLENPMSTFLFKPIVSVNFCIKNSSLTDRTVSVRHPHRDISISSTNCHSQQQQSFTVTYLIDSLGFSQQAAFSASKLVRFKTSEKPDKTIGFLSEFGFTPTQIAKLVRAFPLILTLDTEKNILPKLEFFESKGISRPELAKALAPFPTVLSLSLEKQIEPAFEFYRDFFQSEYKAVFAFRKHPNILVEKFVGQNIATLREHGVPSSNIATLLMRQPRSFLLDSERFRRVVEEVEEMGFRASRSNFVTAVFALRSMTKASWDAKVETYMKWGWTKDMFFEAFEREPRCMLVSEAKISACMDFITNEMGWSSSVLVKGPLIVAMSLEKRVIPRCSVYRALESKGLMKKPFGINTLLYPTEERFLRRFVWPFGDEAESLLRLYEETMATKNSPKKLSL